MKNAILTFAGAVIAAFALTVFLVPYGFAPGGISGVAMIINTLTDGLIPVGASVIVINIPLFILGYKVLGRKFALKSLAGTVLFSFMTGVFEIFLKPEWFYTGEVDILTALYGGLLFGLGLGFIFRGGSTTGGTDIAAKVMQRKMSWLTIGQLVLIFDVILLVVVALAYRDITVAMYSGIVVFVCSKIVDLAEGGINYAKQVYIILPADASVEEFSHQVLKKMDRGITKLEGIGMHSGNSVQILLCIVGNRQLSRLRDVINSFAPEAFVIVNDVREIQGEWEK